MAKPAELLLSIVVTFVRYINIKIIEKVLHWLYVKGRTREPA